MARYLTFCIGEMSFSSSISKIDRDKIYGFVEELVLDENGNACSTASLLDDGQTIVLSGSTALKTVISNNVEVDKKLLKTVYDDGSDAVLVPSSYEGNIELVNANMEDLFNLEVNTVYQLICENEDSKNCMLKEFDGNKIFSFVFNYRTDYEGADAIMLRAQNEVFILTGRLLKFDFIDNNKAIQIEEDNSSDVEEDLDFGML